MLGTTDQASQIVYYKMKKNKTDLKFYLAVKLTWLVILMLGKLCRINFHNQHYWNDLIRQGKGFLVVLWHGKMLLPIYIHRHLGVVAMVSEHRDGEMIAQTVHRLGYKTVRGSSTRGGRKAFIDMLRALRNNKIGTIMPDGPKGPRHYFKIGALVLASRADVAILPMTFAAQWPIVLKSWDRFTFWWPFSRVCMIYGKPVKVPANLSPKELEPYRIIIEKKMIELEKEADAVYRK